MRVKSARSRLIHLQDFATFLNNKADLNLVDIVNDVTREIHENEFIQAPGAFVYELDLAVDTQQVYELGVESLRVDFYKRNPARKRKDTFRQEFPLRDSTPDHRGGKKQSRRKRAQTRRANMREFLEEGVRPFFTTTIDLGVLTANANFQYRNVPTEWLPTAKTHTVYMSSKPEVQGGLKPAEIVSSPIERAPRLSASADASALMRRGMRAHMDPLNVLASPTPMYPTLSAAVDVASTNLSSGMPLEEAELIMLDNIRVRRSLAKTRESLRDQIQDDSDDAVRLAAVISGNVNVALSDKRSLGYRASVRNFQKRIRRRIEIDKSVVGWRRKFYVRVLPIIKPEPSKIRRTTFTRPEIFSVSHKDQLEDMLEPQISPEISLVRNTRGNIVLRVKQVDPTGHSIKIIRRIYSPRSRPKLSQAEVVVDTNTPPGQGSQIITDMGVSNIAPNNIYYRVITRGSRGKLGPSKGLVVKGVDSVVPPPSDDPNTLSIVAKNEIERVKIEVGNIPEEITSIRLLREDLAGLGEFSDRMIVLSTDENETMILEPDGEDLTFYDYHALGGRKYRYFAIMREGFRPEFLSEEDELFIRIVPTRLIPVDISMENTQLKTDRHGNMTFEIDLVSTPKNDNIDFVLDLLRKTGVSTVFLDEIEKQRSDFADVAVFVMERVDRVSGKRVSFGIYPPGKFSDDPTTRQRLGLPDLVPGSRYTYYAKLCIRPPMGLLKSVFTKFSSAQTPGVDNKEALSQKFFSVFANQFGGSPGGALPSTSDLVTGISISENLKAGETGLVLEAELRTPEHKPKPINLTGRSPWWGAPTLLTWTASRGDMGHVDHCLVLVSINNRKVCLGTVASDGMNKSFSFSDRVYGNQPGKSTYTIKFVYRDLSISGESNSFMMHNFSYTPPNFLMDDIFWGVIK